MNVSSTKKQRKYLIAIGSPSCTEMRLPRLDRVETDIQRVENLLIDDKQGYERVLADQIYIGATSNKIKDALTSWFTSSERRNSDCVIIYYAGHGGENKEQNSHYLYTVESTESNFSNTTIKTSDLVQCLFPGNNNSPENILLILDVCYAGEGAKNALVSSFNEFRNATENKCFYVIASADSKTEAGDGDFVDALEKVMKHSEWMSTFNGEFLNPGDLVIRINKCLEVKVSQKAEWSCFGNSKEITFFRNPHFLSQNNLEIDEHNLKKDLTKTKSTHQTVADLLWLLDYSEQEQVFKKVMQDGKERAFLVQTNVEKIQNWLVRRLAGCVPDFEQAKKFTIRISYSIRSDFNNFWQAFKQKREDNLKQETLIQDLAKLCQTKSVIIAIYGLSSLDQAKVKEFYDFWSNLVTEVQSATPRSFRSRLVLLLAEKNSSTVLDKLDVFKFIQPPEINETQYSISLTPLDRISQDDVKNWLAQDNVYSLLEQTENEIQSIVDNDIPTWKEEPLDVLEEICYTFFN
ncbi:MAG: caspase family protein [Scytonema sp. CRU_2_7]|nr:caspase family protein [Scytonema sp. CRU_2_7]